MVPQPSLASTDNILGLPFPQFTTYKIGGAYLVNRSQFPIGNFLLSSLLEAKFSSDGLEHWGHNPHQGSQGGSCGHSTLSPCVTAFTSLLGHQTVPPTD